jgi:tetratricopeptide (TPR) repeat protein
MILASLLVLLAQDAVALPVPAPRPLAEDRLTVCAARARTDPTTAIVEASTWAGETSGADASYPQQCLGLAYAMLLRWGAAERAFLAARDAAEPTDRFRRAQLATMAGNAALAEQRAADALVSLDGAANDAAAADNPGLRAMVEVDRARALVMQGRDAEAEATLAAARTLDAQSPFAWLLSATLARRLGKLDAAQAHIATAAALAPDYPEVGLEAGVIAMLAGRQDAAAASWRSVVELAPDSESAASARAYLAQLDELAADPSTP